MAFLKNTWYVGGEAREVEAGLVARRICDQPIVMYQKSDGEFAALEDRCPHRFVPLSMGAREGDALRCGYHGLLFDASGSCIEKPGGEGENRTPICVRSYPAVKRYGYLWLWMGDVARADPETIPDFSFIDDPEFAVVMGYLNIKSHHEMITDNLLDLSHVQFLHPEVASTSKWSDFQNSVVRDGNTVWSMLSRPNQVPGAFQRMLWESDSPTADGRGNVRWNAPSVLYADTAIAEVGADIETTGLKNPSAHLLTPETETSTHYFWVASRNRRIHDKDIDEMLYKAVGQVFSTQDGPIIEAGQAAIGGSTDFLSHKPLVLKADAAGMAARRILRKMIREEQNEETSEVAADAGVKQLVVAS